MKYQHDVLRLACGDQTTAIAAAGVVHGSFMPYPMTVLGVRASLNAGPTSGALVVDVQEEGESILAAPIELTAGAPSSTGMSTLPFIVDNVLGDAARITVEVLDEASGDATGLTVDIIGHRWIIPFSPPYGLSGASGEGVGLPPAPATPPPVGVTINQAAGQDDPTEDSPIVFDVVFSEAVTGFATGDVTLSGTAGADTATVTDSGDHINFTVEVSGMTGDGTVIASIAAGVCTSTATGSPNAASTSTDNSVTYGAVAVTINQGASQMDPTSDSSIVFDVEFSEAVTGFGTGDVTLSGTATGTLVGTVADSGDHINFTVTVTGMTGDGTVIAEIAASVCTSVATGLPNAASTSTDNTVTWTHAFDPATDMTNLDIWINGANVTVSGADVTNATNLGGGGGSFARIDLSSQHADVGAGVNGHATIKTNGDVVWKWSVGRWLSDDVYDIYALVKGAAQTNRAIASQHKGDTASGRTAWITEDTGTGSKARLFFNNGSSRNGYSADVAFDDTWHVVRWHSTGAGDHYIQIDGGTDTLAITGQQVTPLNTDLRLFGVGGGAGGVIASMFDGEVETIFGCSSVQANSADVVNYLKARAGI